MEEINFIRSLIESRQVAEMKKIFDQKQACVSNAMIMPAPMQLVSVHSVA